MYLKSYLFLLLTITTISKKRLYALCTKVGLLITFFCFYNIEFQYYTHSAAIKSGFFVTKRIKMW